MPMGVLSMPPTFQAAAVSAMSYGRHLKQHLSIEGRKQSVCKCNALQGTSSKPPTSKERLASNFSRLLRPRPSPPSPAPSPPPTASPGNGAEFVPVFPFSLIW